MPDIVPDSPRGKNGRAPDVLRPGGWVPMKEYREDEEVDFAIVGTGAGGATLACRLAEAGFSVVAFDAGAWYRPLEEFASDELEQAKLYWLDNRIVDGGHPIELGRRNSGKAVGGSTVHFMMVSLRFRPEWFKARTKLGYGADWPVDWQEMWRYYDEVEDALKISGPVSYPWGPPRGRYPYRPHEVNAAGLVLARGCENLGIKWSPTPLATVSAPRGLSPPCVYRGFCGIGCSTNAKQSALVVWLPRALAAGAEVRDLSMVGRVTVGSDRRVTGVDYYREGRWRFQKAKNVVVAGYAIETPRLLLNSACPQFPDGLANSNGLVGKYFMVQSNDAVWGLMDDEIRWYKGPPSLAITEHWNYSDEGKDFFGGYAYMSQGPLAIEWARALANGRGLWGHPLRAAASDYIHQAGLKIVGEVMPREENRVELAEEKDEHGLHDCQGDVLLLRERQQAAPACDPLHAPGDAIGERQGHLGFREYGASQRQLPHGRRPEDERGQWRRAVLGHPEFMGLRRLAVPDDRRGQSVADDPGAGVAHRRPHQGPRGARGPGFLKVPMAGAPRIRPLPRSGERGACEPGRGKRAASGSGDGPRFGTLAALDHLDADHLAFAKVVHAAAVQRGNVNEDVLAPVLGRDEAKALLRVEPLHRPGDLLAGRHRLIAGVTRRISAAAPAIAASAAAEPAWAGSTRRLGRRRADLADMGDLRDLPALLTLPDAHTQLRAGDRRAGTRALDGARVQEGIPGAVSQLHEAESLLAIVPFHDGLDLGTRREGRGRAEGRPCRW